MAISDITITQDNIVDGQNLLAIHSPLAYKALATYSGDAPTSLEVSAVRYGNVKGIHAEFDNSYLTAGVSGSDLGTNWTIACWFKLDASEGKDQTIFSDFGYSTGGVLLRVLQSGGVDKLGVLYGSGSGYINADGLVEVQRNRWHHAAVSYDGTTLTVYLNTEEVYSVAATVAVYDSPLYFLSRASAGYQLYGSVMSPVAVGAAYDLGGVRGLASSILESALDGSTYTAYAFSSYENGDIVTTASNIADGQGSSGTITGVLNACEGPRGNGDISGGIITGINKSILLANKDSYVSTGVSMGDLTSSDGFVIAAFFRFMDNESSARLIYATDSAYSISLIIYYEEGVLYYGYDNSDLASYSYIPRVGEWAHIGLRCSGSDMYLVVNGAFVSSFTPSSYFFTNLDSCTGTISLGSPLGASFQGEIAEVFVGSLGLSAKYILSDLIKQAYTSITVGLLCGLLMQEDDKYVGDNVAYAGLEDLKSTYTTTLSGYALYGFGYREGDRNYYESEKEIGTYKMIPYRDCGSTKREFVIRLDGLISAILDDFSDIPGGGPYRSNMMRALTLSVHDTSDTYADGEFIESALAHASRQFGQTSCMQETENNEDELKAYGAIGSYAYVNFFNDNAGCDVILRDAEDNILDTFPCATVGYFRFTVDVTEVEQIVSVSNGYVTKNVAVIGIRGTCTSNSLVKFLASNGHYRIFPFSEGYEASRSLSQIGSVSKLVTDLSKDRSAASNIGYEVTATRTLKAYTNAEQLEYLADIQGSPRVYLHVGDGTTDEAEDWVEVTAELSGGTTRRNAQQMGTTTLTITMPDHYTQTMI